VPLLLPPSIVYDDGTITVNTDMTITYLSVVYTPTTQSLDLYEYYYPGIINLTIAIASSNVFTITAVSQKSVYPTEYKLPDLPSTITTMPTRLLTLDADDKNSLTSYSFSLQFLSGTFS
jgi:hypothetical protein